MNAHLYQEESEHGVGTTLSPEARAAEVERRITDLVAGGKFVLAGGYQSTQGGACGGCAVGALAFSLGCDVRDDDGSFSPDRFVEIHRAGIDHGLCDRGEVFQLEMGYENLTIICFDDGEVAARAEPLNPFYLVGRRLRESIGRWGSPVLTLTAADWSGCA